MSKPPLGATVDLRRATHSSLQALEFISHAPILALTRIQNHWVGDSL